MGYSFKKDVRKSDEELLSLYVISSNQEALGKLFSRYTPLVYGLCLKYLQHQQDAEDAVMHIYVELIEKCLHHEITNFKSWLYSVSKNHCLQIIRSTKPKFFQEICTQDVESEPFLYLIDEEANDHEKNHALNICLETLPKEQHRCIKSFFFDKCSYADIVLLTGYNLKKVKSHIQNGKRNLKSCIVKTLKI